MTEFYRWNRRTNEIEPCDLLTWARDTEDIHRRRVALWIYDDTFSVSTVFLGTDHNFSDHGPPILWETLIKAQGTPLDHEMWRYATYDEAWAGHAHAVRLVRSHVETLADDAVEASSDGSDDHQRGWQ